MHFWFITTGHATPRCHSLADEFSSRYSTDNADVECAIYDFEKLKDLYVRSLTLEQSVPDLVELDLPATQFFMKDEPHTTVIASVKGTWLKNLYGRYKESLFAWNIRGYLGNRGLNREIRQTAQNIPSQFFYFNNGVSAICTRLERDSIASNKFHVRQLQIINGAQTVGALSRTDAPPELEVLFRLTETGDVNIEKGMNRSIIQYNNTQNIIKLSDFRSNDKVQANLEKRFSDSRATGCLPKLAYLRKRGQESGAKRSIGLEEFAKIRYAFKYEPMTLYQCPRDLWTIGIKYQHAFGDGDTVLDVWPDGMFEEARFALVIMGRIEKSVAVEKKRGLHYLHRLRYHLLALVGVGVRQYLNEGQLHQIVLKQERFDKFWDWVWPEAKRTLTQDFLTCTEAADKMTLHAYMRSEERWKVTKKIVEANLSDPSFLKTYT